MPILTSQGVAMSWLGAKFHVAKKSDRFAAQSGNPFDAKRAWDGNGAKRAQRSELWMVYEQSELSKSDCDAKLAPPREAVGGYYT